MPAFYRIGRRYPFFGFRGFVRHSAGRLHFIYPQLYRKTGADNRAYRFDSKLLCVKTCGKIRMPSAFFCDRSRRRGGEPLTRHCKPFAVGAIGCPLFESRKGGRAIFVRGLSTCRPRHSSQLCSGRRNCGRTQRAFFGPPQLRFRRTSRNLCISLCACF